MDVVTRVELECSYGAGDGRTRSRVVSMPKERSGGPRLDRSCDWEKYGYDTLEHSSIFFSGRWLCNMSLAYFTQNLQDIVIPLTHPHHL